MSKPARRARAGVRTGATIKDVARIAGVSPMTVSRVVNGSEYVRNVTRQGVQRAHALIARQSAAAPRRT